MYFWNIEALKAKMATRPLTDREVFPYFFAWMIVLGLYGIFAGLASESGETSEPLLGTKYLGEILSAVILLWGIIHVWGRNGGGNGRYFLQRVFALGWVVAIRWFALYLLVFMVLLLLSWDTELGWMGITDLVFSILFYLWLGHHIKDVADRTIPGAVAAESFSQNTESG